MKHHLRALPTTEALEPDAADGPSLGPELRVDLHVHSCHSDRPYSYFLRSGKAAECYTRPETVHELATRRGMDLVTICDHDEIAGAIELCARTEHAFVSEEVSARFPEDGCVMHTIVLGLDETQHREIQELRRNVYELVAYLQAAGLPYFLCHPLSSVNRRLTAHHLRRALLMFPALELRNGTRDQLHEQELTAILTALTPVTLAGWASDHPEAPWVTRDARYAVVGGSDDHGGLAIGRAYTAFRGERSLAGLTAALRARRTMPRGLHGTATALSHNVIGVLGGYLRQQGQLPFGPGPLEPQLAALMAAEVGPGRPDAPAAARGLLAPLARPLFAAATREGVGFSSLARAAHTDDEQARLTRVLDGALLVAGRAAVTELADAAAARALARAADAVPDVLRCALLSLPYVLGARYQGADRATARRLADQLGFTPPRDEAPRVAVITDTIDDVNGVALGLRRLAVATRKAGLPLDLVGPGAADAVEVVRDEDGVVRVPALLRRSIDLYPDMTWAIPHLPALLRWLCDERIDVVQCATPGPMGLAGLAAARLLSRPVVAQYHTELPEYASRLSGDPVVGSVVGSVVSWFYRQADLCLAPSRTIAQRLSELGVAGDRVAQIPRGIDLDLFRPDRRDPAALARWGLDGRRVVLYVGRLSKEKNLDALLDAYRRVQTTRPDVALLLVGDGPHGAALARRGAPLGVRFAGVLHAHELAAVYASADVLAFPSETETFGNVVVEAQASGLPVVVARGGAAHETVLHGVTGLVVDGEPGDLARALASVLDDPAARARMGNAAHRFAQRYDLAQAARAGFELYRRVADAPRDVRAGEPAPSPVPATPVEPSRGLTALGG